MPFLDKEICRRISENGRDLKVSARFETELPGLYTVGMTAMDSFGPLLRFMVGSKFVAPRLAAHLRRRIWLERTNEYVARTADAIFASFKAQAMKMRTLGL
jgi:hypothetical protein